MRPRLLFGWGLGIWALLVAELVLLRIASPTIAEATVLGMTAEIFAGREVGIPVALEAGAPPLLVFQVSLTQDVGSALLVYPLFLWAIQHFHDKDNVVMRRVRRIETAAERHEKYVHRWGPLGVALFMLVPFLVNGPLVGLVLGRLGGLRTKVILGPVVGATIVAAAMWTFFFEGMLALAHKVHPAAGWAIALAALGVVVLVIAVDWVRDELRHRARSK